ncbi:MAG: lipopolysaccharide kinase InaA family protein [Verrucomicrobia bacterium]|nr:lipopolysaccharide kinase InaA family protein [Verrucomicrobiota bacterium]
MLKNWVHHIVSTDDGETLHVYCHAGDPDWVRWAADLWQDRVDHMTNVRTHKWGGTVDRVRMSDGHDYFYKRFRIKGWRQLHKPRRARTTVKTESRLAEQGFNVPRAVCVIEKRRLGIAVDSALITRAIPNAHRLSHILNRSEFRERLSTDRRRALLRSFMKEVARLHNAGMYHGDLHLHNVLCRINDDGFEFFWMDNERGRSFPKIPETFRIDDLNQINKYKHAITLTDRMRLWKSYCEEAGIPESDRSQLIAKIIARSQYFWRKRGWL